MNDLVVLLLANNLGEGVRADAVSWHRRGNLFFSTFLVERLVSLCTRREFGSYPCYEVGTGACCMMYDAQSKGNDNKKME